MASMPNIRMDIPVIIKRCDFDIRDMNNRAGEVHQKIVSVDRNAVPPMARLSCIAVETGSLPAHIYAGTFQGKPVKTTPRKISDRDSSETKPKKSARISPPKYRLLSVHAIAGNVDSNSGNARMASG